MTIPEKHLRVLHKLEVGKGQRICDIKVAIPELSEVEIETALNDLLFRKLVKPYVSGDSVLGNQTFYLKMEIEAQTEVRHFWV